MKPNFGDIAHHYWQSYNEESKNILEKFLQIQP
jgi:hypothetical protein